MYRDGRGVEQNDDQAIYWYRKAADQGHADAQKIISEMYAEGKI